VKRIVIGLCGAEGAGKTAAGRIIVEQFGGVVIPFAQPLKKMLEALGVPKRNLYGSLEEKLTPLELLGGHSARWAAQSLGTEWGRDLIHTDLWANAWKAAVEKLPGVNIIADDLRFQNEARAVHDLGGHVICLLRPEADDRSGKEAHRSQEYWKLSRDATVVNDGSLEGLRASLCNALAELNKKSLKLVS